MTPLTRATPDSPLRQFPLHRHLSFRAALFGVAYVDWAVATAPVLVAYVLTFVGVSIIAPLAVALIAVPAMLYLRRGKPAGFFPTLVENALRARRLSHKEAAPALQELPGGRHD